MAEETGWRDAARALTLRQDDGAALAWLAAPHPLPEAAWPPAPEALVHRASAEAPAAHHARRLAALAREADADPLERAWHARWLWHLLAPDDPAALPRISVVIPVYNRAGLVVEAVASVLDSDYPATEILVVDDGSSDDPGAALARFGDRVVFQRMAKNGGVSAARNLALARATGELVHILDSDDMLPPDALRRKVAALAHVPDALLCFSSFEQRWRDGRKEIYRWPDLGKPLCPTQWPAVGLIHRFPFLISTLLVARHLVRRAGDFDPRLRQHEDRLLFQRFGLMEAKCVAIDEPLLWARVEPDSLARQDDQRGHAALCALIFLSDLLRHPERWDLAGFMLQQCFWRNQWRLLNQEPNPDLAAEQERFFAGLDDFIEGRHLPQYSPRPLGAEFAAVLAGREASGDSGTFVTPFRQRLERMAAARPAGPDDLALWRRSHNPPANAAALLTIFPELSAALRAGRPWVPLASLDQRPFRSLPHRWRRGWKQIAQSARLFGERPARLVAKLRG